MVRARLMKRAQSVRIFDGRRPREWRSARERETKEGTAVFTNNGAGIQSARTRAGAAVSHADSRGRERNLTENSSWSKGPSYGGD